MDDTDVVAGPSNAAMPVTAKSPTATTCVLQGNLKVFARAILSLSKLGDELFLQPTFDGLAVRSVNGAKSAYGCFLFARSFFFEYALADGPQADKTSQILANGGGFDKQCKISMKCALSVFKSPPFLERAVSVCTLTIDPAKDKLVVEMRQKFEVYKTYKIPFLDLSAGVKPSFDKNTSRNIVRCEARVIFDAIGHLHALTEEVTVKASLNDLNLRNYVEAEPDRSKVVKTEITVVSGDFEQFEVKAPALDVTLCLKELRAIISFAEGINAPITFYYDAPGRPFIAALESDLSYTADFVIATLADHTGGVGQQRTDEVRSTLDYVSTNNDSTTQQQHVPSSQPVNSEAKIAADGVCPQASAFRSLEVQRNNITDQNGDGTTVPQSSFSGQLRSAGGMEMEQIIDQQIDDGDEDVLPGTPPPPKRFRSMFLGLSQSTMHSSQLHEEADTLVTDSP